MAFLQKPDFPRFLVKVFPVTVPLIRRAWHADSPLARGINAIMNESEADLLRRVAKKDMEARGELYLRYQERFLARGKAWYSSRSTFDVLTVCGETFDKIEQKAAEFIGCPTDPQADRKVAIGWIWAVFSDMCRKELRRAAKLSLTEDVIDNAAPATPSSSLTPYSIMVAREKLDALLQAVPMLSANHRRAILLRYFSDIDLDPVAIGQRLNVSRKRVDVWLARARALLWRALEKKGHL
jgi:RNA polymerase sigma factor (sigma-70 family)